MVLVYRISGGPPGKRLDTALHVSSDGEVTYEHGDELTPDEKEGATTRLPRADVMSLFRRVRESGLLDQDERGSGFLPDSVIASISIQAEDGRITYYFLADERQQRWQGKEPAPAIRELKPVLDALLARVQAELGPDR